jgi:hypothetical protein
VVCTNVNGARVGADEARTFGRRFVDIVDESIGWVCFSPEGEHIEEIRNIVVIFEDIASYARVDKQKRKKQSNDWHLQESRHGMEDKR